MFQTGGPIVEQATHFCDLSRFFAGEVELPSLNAIAVAGAGMPTISVTLLLTIFQVTHSPHFQIYLKPLMNLLLTLNIAFLAPLLLSGMFE